MRITPSFGAAVLALAGLQAGAASPGDAALPLALAGAGPYYTLDVGLRARAVSASPDLADLRVRNGAGETMAFAWADAALSPASAQSAPARLYKVPLPPADAASATSEAAPRQAWIVDARAAGDDLLRLDLALEPGTQGVYTLRIEASDDLQHWRTLQDDAQLVQLQALPQVGAAGTLAPLAERERLGTSGIDLDDVRARYLRVTTAPRSAIPPLVSATVTRAPHRPPPPPLEWSAAIGAAGCDASSCDYPLPRNASVAAVQVAPSDLDTIAPAMLLGRREAGQAAPPRHSLLRHPLHALRLKAERSATSARPDWDSIALTSVYWLTQAAGAPDLHSPPLRLDGAAWQALRLETFGPIAQLGHGAPTLRIGVRTRQLVFVARGAGPFTLVRAAPADTTTALSLAELMPGRAPDAALPAATATLAPAAAHAASAVAVAPPAAPPASSAPWLWAALLAGLALMAAMAWSLLRKPSRPPA